MTNQPLLTAVIFTYNHKNSIAKCIESLVNQKTTYPYVIRIYDDCSIDGTSSICKEYAKKYSDKIELTIQEHNTFCGPYEKMQAFQAMQDIQSKYFCIIDGDDYWCNENKIQMALDFLENNPKYIGWAHDTLQVNEFDGTEVSYIHDICKIDKIKNPVTFSADAPFFLTSSRIFRNVGFAKEKICPIDYLLYYYHLSKGYIYYCDEIMAVYNIGLENTFANLVDVPTLNSMFAFKLSKLFKFKQDEFCTAMQLKYDNNNKIGRYRYDNLCRAKKYFGVKFGWYLWFVLTFVLKYGAEVKDIMYVYDRRQVFIAADRKKKIDEAISKCDKKIIYKMKYMRYYEKILKYEKYLPKFLINELKISIKRKKDVITKAQFLKKQLLLKKGEV